MALVVKNLPANEGDERDAGRKIPWRREWLPTPVFLPGKFHGHRGAWWAIVYGVAKCQTGLRDWHRINKYQHQPKLPFCCIHYYRYTHTRMWIFELFIFLGNTFIFFLQFRVKILPILIIEANICHKSFLFILVVQQSSVVKSVSSGGLCLKQFPQTLWTSGFLSIKSWLILFTLHSYWEH